MDDLKRASCAPPRFPFPPNDRRWLWLVYGVVFVPLVGQLVVVVTSSVLHDRWRRSWPNEAFWLNVHAWIAVGLNIGLVWLETRLFRR
jgi:hypothetical protein